MGWWEYDYPPRSVPRGVKGGIKAQTRWGAFGKSWWAKRWIAVLESFHLGNRLSRGRSYARRGQVVSIDISKGVVRAEVQGSRPHPYRVSIQVKALSAADWKKVAEAISAQAIYAAKLLNGEMPEDIETVFRGARIPLFPERLKDLKTDCSCPDWSNPCKHIAAVYYLMGEEFDREPFLLFRLRGIDRDEILSMLREESPEAEAESPPEPLPADPGLFWNGDPPQEEPEIGWRKPPVAAALPRRLGNFPFWRGNLRFQDFMTQIYDNASEYALQFSQPIDLPSKAHSHWV